MDDQAYVVVAPDGKEVRIPRSDVVAMEAGRPVAPPAEEPKPAKEVPAQPAKGESKYATPQKTFEQWRQAAVRGDQKAMLACYAKYRQPALKGELGKISREKRKEMSAVTGQTDFTVGEPMYQGDLATLEVTWRMGLQSDVQLLQFKQEGADWKIIQ